MVQAKAIRRISKAIDSEDERVALKASEIILGCVPLPTKAEEKQDDDLAKFLERVKGEVEGRRKRESSVPNPQNEQGGCI
jgi:hypothetical protein